MGKSTLLNALARTNPAAEGEEVFRVQNFEHQMLAEHCTNGIDVFVTNRRIILLDCQVADLVHKVFHIPALAAPVGLCDGPNYPAGEKVQ